MLFTPKMVYNIFMKIVYCGVSARFSHSMPAGWFLCEYLASKGIATQEIYHNINEDYNKILQNVLLQNTDILLLSVYIFNAAVVKRLIKDIKNMSNCTIVIGGPEADSGLGADKVITGEGEQALYNYLVGKGVVVPLIAELDSLPSPYTEKRLQQAKHKLIYYESSRGCPFTCAYCCANASKVRYFSLDRVKTDLERIVQSGAKVIKFTDRTFNLHHIRANEILTYISTHFRDRDVCFHFEVMGELLHESTKEILLTLPVGLVQLEIGVQSLHEPTLKAVARKTNLSKLQENIAPLIAKGNVHVHLDLIAGLPYESLDSFISGFDRVFALKPNVVQLGFLKVLKGTPIRDNFTDIQYSPLPPYEIISTPDMSSKELLALKSGELALDKLYNSGAFIHSLEYLLSQYDSACKMFIELGQYLQESGINKISQRPEYFAALMQFDKSKRFRELLRLDFLCSDAGKKIPKFLRGERTKLLYAYTNDYGKESNFFEQFSYLPSRQEQGEYIVEFDYSAKNAVSKRYPYRVVR